MSVNVVIFEGRAGQEPKIFKGENDSTVARLSLANNEKVTNVAGVTVDQTTWKDVVAFGPAARFVEKYVHKGSRVLVQGFLSDRAYEKDGQNHKVTEIHVVPGRGSIELLDAIGKRADQKEEPAPAA